MRRQTLPSNLDTRSPHFEANRAAVLERLAEIKTLLAAARAGGGPKLVARHHERGKLLVRERIELLIDRDSPFLELSPLAAAGTEYEVGASTAAGIGVVAGVECYISGNDPTVRGGAVNPYTMRKGMRGFDISMHNRLPHISLTESGGADLPRQSEIFLPGGASFRHLTQLSAAGIPTIALVFGNSTAGGAYTPAMCDYTVFVRNRAKVFLGGPPLVKMATGEESNDEELGGAEMHSRISGLSDYLAEDELDALRIGREIVANLGWKKLGPPPNPDFEEPLYDAEDLLGLAPADLKIPVDMREIIARIVDGSQFHEFKPAYGANLLTGWASLHGYEIGILANQQGVLFSSEAQKAAQFIQLANQRPVPLLFIQNVTGYMVGKQYEQAGIIKHGAHMINAVSNSKVPHLTLQIGGSYGAGNYGMCGYAYRPRFLFIWPNSKTAVMGPQQLAGVLSIVRRAAAQAGGKPFDEAQDEQFRRAVEEQIEKESLATFTSGQVFDDGIIDPRDSRTVLGIALSAALSAEVAGAERFGVFRM
ncbi:MAG TPA: carboxyl transferase domain-containing protein [Pirellulales bacterium]|nr:carboxyl transferase domain-containing protein [Pirellulales bacterium]